MHAEDLILLIIKKVGQFPTVTRIINPGAAAHSLTYNIHGLTVLVLVSRNRQFQTNENKRLQFHVPS